MPGAAARCPMSHVLVVPQIVAVAAADVGRIGASLAAWNAAAAASTTAVVSAAGDQVSAAIAALFSQHGQGYQALAKQVAAFHHEFAQALSTGAGSYAAAEAPARRRWRRRCLARLSATAPTPPRRAATAPTAAGCSAAAATARPAPRASSVATAGQPDSGAPAASAARAAAAVPGAATAVTAGCCSATAAAVGC